VKCFVNSFSSSQVSGLIHRIRALSLCSQGQVPAVANAYESTTPSKPKSAGIFHRSDIENTSRPCQRYKPSVRASATALSIRPRVRAGAGARAGALTLRLKDGIEADAETGAKVVVGPKTIPTIPGSTLRVTTLPPSTHSKASSLIWARSPIGHLALGPGTPPGPPGPVLVLKTNSRICISA
jgi:hypothetical protein